MKLSVLQWNVWYKEDIGNIVSELKYWDADVVCLQELTFGYNPEQPDVPRYIAQELGYHYYTKELELPENWNIGNGIFSRYPLSDNTFTLINESLGSYDYDDEPRALLESTINVEGQKIRIGTVHMSYTKEFKATERKSQETKQLIKAIEDKKERFILTGDFNSLPGSETIASIREHMQSAGPDFYQNTWTTKPFTYGGFEADTLSWRLDYIFHTPDMKVAEVEILKTECSDHLPVLARFELS